MTAHTRPWTALYQEGQPRDTVPEFETALDMALDGLRRRPDAAAILWFDARISASQLDTAAAALAAAFQDAGVGPGDRVALFSQNHPAFVIGMMATWHLGAVAVPVNPMYKARELRHVLNDSGARALVCLDEVAPVVAEVLHGTAVQVTVVAATRDLQQRDDPRVMSDAAVDAGSLLPGALSLVDVLDRWAGRRPGVGGAVMASDPAFLVYTSGTTGDPKGARLTHANVVANAQNYRDWMQLGPDDVVLAVAPLFHITGLVGHAVLSLLLPAPLVLGHRFRADVMVDLVREHRPTFTVGAITAFVAMADVPGVGPRDFASLRSLWSGGAPIAPATADRVQRALGHYVHNAYGLTETASITHLVPPGRTAPVDPASGALSIGVPIASVDARILDDAGHELSPGQVGELAIRGPQVADGYWGRPDASERAFPGGELRTGDVAFRDEEGWFFLVDRKKDMIIASGYKVWPREVEDVLLAHPSVREAAVVGVSDDYRGETVHAFVSILPGREARPEELVAWCRERMAAYKYPRQVSVLPELPKTASGKILRRSLRS